MSFINYIATHLTTRTLGIFVGAVSAGALISAFTAQYVFDLQPCILCIYQRIPYALVMALGALACFLSPRAGRALIVLSGLAFLVGGGIAFFHVGVEHKWWEGTDACASTLDVSNIDALREQILHAKRPRCDEPQWSMFGITMAGYNVAMSLGLAVLSFIGVRHVKENP